MEEKQQNLKKHIFTLITADKFVNSLSKLCEIARLFIRDHIEIRYVKCIKSQFNKNKSTKSKTLIRIIYLMDKLIKEYQTFRPFISQVVCQIFVQLFSIFLETNSRSEIQELKMNRKAWVTLISDDVLQNIKKSINKLFSFNIDSGFSKKKLNELKQYYTQKLKLSHAQCLKYLPDDAKKQTQQIQDYNYYQEEPQPKKKSPIIPPQPQEKPKYQPNYTNPASSTSDVSNLHNNIIPNHSNVSNNASNYSTNIHTLPNPSNINPLPNTHNTINMQHNTQLQHQYFPYNYPMQIQNINTKPSSTTYVFGAPPYPNNYPQQMYPPNNFQNYHQMNPMVDQGYYNSNSYFNNPTNPQVKNLNQPPFEVPKNTTPMDMKFSKPNYEQTRNNTNKLQNNNMNTLNNIYNNQMYPIPPNMNQMNQINQMNTNNPINNNLQKKQQQSFESNILQKYRELKQLGKHKCPRCGLLTANRENYDLHLRNHYEQSKRDYELTKKGLMSTRSPLLNLQNWISLNEATNQQQYYLQLQKITQNFCKFCCNKFHPKWDSKLEKWIYKNVIIVEINKKAKTTMHFTCFNSLQEEIKTDMDYLLI